VRGRCLLPKWPSRNIALNWDGTPAVKLKRPKGPHPKVNEVDAEFVAAQGEFRIWTTGARRYKSVFSPDRVQPDMKLNVRSLHLIR